MREANRSGDPGEFILIARYVRVVVPRVLESTRENHPDA